MTTARDITSEPAITEPQTPDKVRSLQRPFVVGVATAAILLIYLFWPKAMSRKIDDAAVADDVAVTYAGEAPGDSFRFGDPLRPCLALTVMSRRYQAGVVNLAARIHLNHGKPLEAPVWPDGKDVWALGGAFEPGETIRCYLQLPRNVEPSQVERIEIITLY